MLARYSPAGPVVIILEADDVVDLRSRNLQGEIFFLGKSIDNQDHIEFDLYKKNVLQLKVKGFLGFVMYRTKFSQKM